MADAFAASSNDVINSGTLLFICTFNVPSSDTPNPNEIYTHGATTGEEKLVSTDTFSIIPPSLKHEPLPSSAKENSKNPVIFMSALTNISHLRLFSSDFIFSKLFQVARVVLASYPVKSLYIFFID